jgi:predicted nucleic acid-binding protein
MRVLLDNTVLTNYAQVGRPHIVSDIWGEMICTTPEVLAEYAAGTMTGVVPDGVWDTLQSVALSTEEHQFALSLPSRLGSGERSCLAVAVYRGWLFVSDDADARLIANRLGVPITGTLGILIRAVKEGVISFDTAEGLLQAMIAYGYHTPVQTLSNLIPPVAV